MGKASMAASVQLEVDAYLDQAASLQVGGGRWVGGGRAGVLKDWGSRR